MPKESCLAILVFCIHCILLNSFEVYAKEIVELPDTDPCAELNSGKYEWEGRTVYCLKGVINEELVETLIGEISSSKSKESKPILISVNSIGGSVDASLSLLEYLKINHFDIILPPNSVCFSSCANYLFLGARKKFISASAVIGWHGGPPQNKRELSEFLGLDLRSAKDLNRLSKDWLTISPLIERNNTFLEQIGRSKDIIYGLPYAIECSSVASEVLKFSTFFWAPSFEMISSFYEVPGIAHERFSFHASSKVFDYLSHEDVQQWTVNDDCLAETIKF